MAPKQTAHGLIWHPSLKNTFKGCERWLESAAEGQWLGKAQVKLTNDLSADGAVDLGIYRPLQSIGHAFGVQASIAGSRGEQASLANLLQWAVKFNALAFGTEALMKLPGPDHRILKFTASMRVAGAVMLSCWNDAKLGTTLLVEVAQKDQSVSPALWRKDGWGKGTHDAFLIYLLAEAFGIQTHYEPAEPLIPEYRGLLQAWRTTDRATYHVAMRAAAEFHISRSKDATERNDYEFDDYFHRVYPAELLAVQALRRRDGLPEFEAGHLLVDTPWSILRDLPPVGPHPLLVATEARMKRDYPASK